MAVAQLAHRRLLFTAIQVSNAFSLVLSATTSQGHWAAWPMKADKKLTFVAFLTSTAMANTWLSWGGCPPPLILTSSCTLMRPAATRSLFLISFVCTWWYKTWMRCKALAAATTWDAYSLMQNVALYWIYWRLPTHCVLILSSGNTLTSLNLYLQPRL